MRAEYLAERYSRMVLNVMVRHTDDHPRHHGLLANGLEMGLSPAYDMAPTLTPRGVGTEFRLAMSAGNQGYVETSASFDRMIRWPASTSTGSQYGTTCSHCGWCSTASVGYAINRNDGQAIFTK